MNITNKIKLWDNHKRYTNIWFANIDDNLRFIYDTNTSNLLFQKNINGIFQENGINGSLIYNNDQYKLSAITYTNTQNNQNNSVIISHYDNKRMISIFNQQNQTTRYIIDEINLRNEKQQFNEYIDQQIPKPHNLKLDITLNNDGTINKIDKKPETQNELKEVLNSALQARLNVSNGVNIGLSNNIIVPLIMACNEELFKNEKSNIRLINSNQQLNEKFSNKGEKQRISKLGKKPLFKDQA